MQKDDSLKVPDTQLWQEFQSGSEAAFASIYRDYADRLYSYGMKLVKNRALVMDAIQDLFVELWDTRERLGNVKYIKSYLYKSIRRKILSKSNKEAKIQRLDNTEVPKHENTPSPELRLIEKLTFDENRNALKTALGKLSKKQQEIIHLKYYARLSYNEIAQVMSMNKKAAYNLMTYTLRLLKQFLTILALSILLHPVQ